MTTRRSLLRTAAGLGGVFLLTDLATSFARGSRRRGEAAAPPETRAYHWRDPAATDLSAASAQGEGTAAVRIHTSAIHRAPGPFNAIGGLWTGPLASLEVRASADGATWTDWRGIDAHEQEHMRPSADARTAGGLFTGSSWRYVQYRAAAPAERAALDVELVLIDSSEGPDVAAGSPSGAVGAAATKPKIVSRAEWGCNESYRFDSSGEEIWPRECRMVQKGIVHHTVTSQGGPDVVRSIYYYHAVTLGWGDIGYNYLVDRVGNVYQGRFGSEHVVAGHALRYNWGSTGLACIGDFRSATPTQEMKDALARITAWICRGLDPHGQSYFVDKTCPNIMGHRDVLSTACPGDVLYGYLPTLRDAVKSLNSTMLIGSRSAGAAASTVTSASPSNKVYLSSIISDYCE